MEQSRKLKLREGQGIAQGHMDPWHLNPGLQLGQHTNNGHSWLYWMCLMSGLGDGKHTWI